MNCLRERFEANETLIREVSFWILKDLKRLMQWDFVNQPLVVFPSWMEATKEKATISSALEPIAIQNMRIFQIPKKLGGYLRAFGGSNIGNGSNQSEAKCMAKNCLICVLNVRFS